MKKINCIAISAFLVAGIQSCNNPQPQRDLYVDTRYDDIATPKYYKNGAGSTLDFRPTGTLVIDGNDIYYPKGNGYRKNGAQVTLPDAKAITSVYVKNGTVYALGKRTSGHLCYWMGTQMIEVEPASVPPVLFSGKIVVSGSGNQVHIGGTIPNTGSGIFIYHWSNQVLDTVAPGFFIDMAIKGSDVHIVGSPYRPDTPITGYWKNGVNQSLYGMNGQLVKGCTHVSVWNDDVYITAAGAGTLYWKNGQPTSSIGSDIYPQGVMVDNGNVIVGVNREPLHGPMNTDYYIELWKGGIVQPLGDGWIVSMQLGN
jgi:hypothetical protein